MHDCMAMDSRTYVYFLAVPLTCTLPVYLYSCLIYTTYKRANLNYPMSTNFMCTRNPQHRQIIPEFKKPDPSDRSLRRWPAGGPQSDGEM
jgi:hypothetical protein